MENIKLSIQEIVHDFEWLIRFDEHVTTLEEIDRLSDENSIEFLMDVDMMIRKYIPNYQTLPEVIEIPKNASDKHKARVLSGILQKNFKEIFCGLI